MNSKGVAAFIAAIIILSSLFFFIHVVPPTGPVKIPKNVIPPPNINETFFYNETLVPVTLDTDNATLFNFSFSGNATTVITGYLKNASSGQLIQGSEAFISLYPAGAISRINSGKTKIEKCSIICVQCNGNQSLIIEECLVYVRWWYHVFRDFNRTCWWHHVYEEEK